MKQVPNDLKYLSTHEWTRQEDKETFTVGITAHAQDLLGDIVYVELPPLGKRVVRGQECGVVESVKAASDIYSPLSGKVIEINETLAETPGLVNEDPYGSGWIFRVKLDQPEEVCQLLSPESYAKQINKDHP